MIFVIIVPVLLYSFCCSAQVPPTVQPLSNDTTNWEELWKAMNASGMSRTDDPSISVFDTILRVNAKERGTPGTGRTDNDIFLYEGDIQMTKSEVETLIGQGSQGTSRQKRAVMRKTGSNLWRPNIAYTIDRSLGSRARLVVQSAVREWQTTLSCMGRWRDVTRTSKPRDYMHFFQGGGCYSQVGRVGGGQRVSIGRGCEYHGIAVHEIGHAMGLWHEQSRPDRDSYVRIIWNNIVPAMKFNFQKHSTSRVNSLGVPYDYGSVMHYGATAFARSYGLKTISSVRGQQTLGQRRGLSASDKKQAKLLYGCTTTVKPTRPAVCRDTATHKTWCAESLKLGLCTNSLFKRYTMTHCCLTCRPTPPKPTGCKNIQSQRNCNSWRKYGYCKKGHNFESYMKKNCCKACTAFQSATKNCVDKNKNCEDLEKQGYCKTSVNYMKKNCAKSCGC